VAGTAVLGRLTWLVAEVVELVTETARVRTIVLDVPDWPGHRAGQHLDVRLTAEDGYQAQRSYSIASPPGEPIAITVEVLDDGEVSPYLAEELREGDEIEVRGPIGGYFVWEPGGEEPLLLVGGGSGVVPLMAMIRHRAATGDRTPARLVYSSRRLEEVIYRAELEELQAREDGLEVFQTLTREQPPGWEGYSRRVDAELMRDVAWEPSERPAAYICGSTGFVEAAAGALVQLGHEPLRIKTERYGATGGG
jgi:ferredoxin-NADP reductase